jgi:DNA modification methylase
LGKEPNAEDMLREWLKSGYMEVKGVGFMGKEWDSFVPQPIFWKEVFRVLKPGGYVLAFYGTRTYDWGVMAMRLAGFEVRDCIQWVYGSGFPKSHNIGKAVDKLQGNEREVVGDNPNKRDSKSSIVNVQTDECKITKGKSEWEGWGSALKPAVEPIVVCRKPLEKGLSIAENVLKWGTGGINVDGCRVGMSNDDFEMNTKKASKENNGVNFDIAEGKSKGTATIPNTEGRFPANLILTHHPDCVCVGMKKVKSIKGGNNGTIGNEVYGKFKGEKNNDGCGYADENGEENVENWNCHPDCPCYIMDRQSGESKSSDYKYDGKDTNTKFGQIKSSKREKGYIDKGGASRFFYQAKASKSERNRGLEGFEEKTSGSLNFRNPSASGRSEDAPSVEKMGGITKSKQNFHPTVKPVKLMQYLVRLVTPPNGLVLDPFCGSGTTGIACRLEGFNFVGMEREEDYAKIAQARIDNWFGASAKESVPESSPSARLEKPKEIPTQLKFNF